MPSIIGEQIRRLGYSARVHSVLNGDVLQPPLLLLSGLGEVSRIGEVILNPYLGPRLKSGTVTTDLPMAYDKPIDFGLQTFCQNCNKCARECPSGPRRRVGNWWWICRASVQADQAWTMPFSACARP